MYGNDKSASGPAAGSPATAAAAPPATTAETIDRWFIENFQQPPIAHRTDCYNQALAARDKLKALLAVRNA